MWLFDSKLQKYAFFVNSFSRTVQCPVLFKKGQQLDLAGLGVNYSYTSSADRRDIAVLVAVSALAQVESIPTLVFCWSHND